jgi:allantoin racemase
MKIGIIVPNVNMTQQELAERKRFVLRVCNPDTEIEMIKNEKGPVTVESELDQHEASVQVVRAMIRLQKEGFDAFIPWCTGDPGVIAGREQVRVPVVGPFQSSCLIAASLGFKFSIITPVMNRHLLELQVKFLGLYDRLATICELSLTVPELRQDMIKTVSLVERLCKETAQQTGTEAFVMNCMGLFGVAEQIKDRFPIPVIDPAWAAVQMAQAIVRMGLTHSPPAWGHPG